MEKYNAWKAACGTEFNWGTLNDNDIDTTPVSATQPLQLNLPILLKRHQNISWNVAASPSLPTTSTPSLQQ